MNPYDRPTDSLPISRRTVIMNTGLAAAAIAGLSSCTVYGSAPVTEPTPRRLWRSLRRDRWKSGADSQSRGYPGRQRQGVSRCADGDHAAESKGIQGVQLDLYPSGLPGGRCHHHDQLPLSWQQILDHRRLGGESSGAQAAAGKDDQGRGRQSGCHLIKLACALSPSTSSGHVRLRRR